MSRPAAPLAAAVPLHGSGTAHGHGDHAHDGGAHDHAHGHGHGHGHAHGHAAGAPHGPDTAAAPDATLPASLLMAGAGSRLLATLGLLALLWAAVAWALGDSA